MILMAVGGAAGLMFGLVVLLVRMRNNLRLSAQLDAGLRRERAISKLLHELGRVPTDEEVREALGLVLAPKKIKFWENCEVPRAVPRKSRAAQRKLVLALLFIPHTQRERFHREWTAEMATMSPQVAAVWALQILRTAPMTGIILASKRAFGRKAA